MATAVMNTRTITRSLQLFVQLIAWRQPHWLLIGHRSDSTRYPRSRCEPHALLSCGAKNQCKAPGDRSLVVLEYPRDMGPTAPAPSGSCASPGIPRSSVGQLAVLFTVFSAYQPPTPTLQQ